MATVDLSIGKFANQFPFIEKFFYITMSTAAYGIDTLFPRYFEYFCKNLRKDPEINRILKEGEEYINHKDDALSYCDIRVKDLLHKHKIGYITTEQLEEDAKILDLLIENEYLSDV